MPGMEFATSSAKLLQPPIDRNQGDIAQGAASNVTLLAHCDVKKYTLPQKPYPGLLATGAADNATMHAENGEGENATHEGPVGIQPMHTTKGFTLNLADAFTPDPGTEDMFETEDNKFAFSPGQLSKMLNPKSHNAFYALGGLLGLERGLKTDTNAGLSNDETAVNDSVNYEDVAAKDSPKYGATGDSLPKSKTPTTVPTPAHDNKSSRFIDRRRIFSENRLPDKKNKSFLQLAWQTYNDKVLILLSIAAIVSLALGLYQTFGGAHEEGEVGVEWIEGVAILVAIAIVVIVGSVNDWNMQRQFNQLNKNHDNRFINVIRSGHDRDLCVRCASRRCGCSFSWRHCPG
ncbi:hypothetical protein V2G26_018243 [Clonostachys chloroleuca]